MFDLKLFEKEIQTYIKPTTLPLAIKLLTSEGEIPEKTRRPKKDFQKRFAICQAVGMARKTGLLLALGREDISCPPSQVVLGFEGALGFLRDRNIYQRVYTSTKEAG